MLTSTLAFGKCRHELERLRPQLLEGVAGKEGGDFFQEGWGGMVGKLSHNKLKSEIINDKKSS